MERENKRKQKIPGSLPSPAWAIFFLKKKVQQMVFIGKIYKLSP
jgi:hypothetical protein